MSNKGHDYKVHSGADFRKQRQGNRGSNATAEFNRCADTEMTCVDWLWSNHLARGKLTMLAGDSALGKSQISICLAATLTKTGEWPDGDAAPSGSVIILSAEDAINDTIVPRLAAAGADLTRVYCLRCVRVDGQSRSFNIQSNMDLIAKKVREVGDVALIIIDPVTAYFGSEIDSHRITDVRAALLPLEQFAAQLEVAVLCIAHPPKTPSMKALNFIAGSGAFTHAPRLAFIVIEDPEAPGRNLLLAVKNSLGRKADGLGYSIISTFVGLGESILTSRIEWDDRPVYMTADEVLRAHAEKNKAKAKTEAEDFLRTKMQPGQDYNFTDIKKEAAEAGIPERTLRRASDSLGVKKSRNGFGSKMWWKRDEH
jgi:putative DNA primase/helicase